MMDKVGTLPLRKMGLSTEGLPLAIPGLRSLMTSDYLFNAYQLSGDRLEVVAAFYVSKVRGRLLSATVE